MDLIKNLGLLAAFLTFLASAGFLVFQSVSVIRAVLQVVL